MKDDTLKKQEKERADRADRFVWNEEDVIIEKPDAETEPEE